MERQKGWISQPFKSSSKLFQDKLRPRAKKFFTSPILYTDGRYCRKCEATTGTPEGLRALVSEDGYTHLSLNEIRWMAAMGCVLCGHIMRIVRRYKYHIGIRSNSEKSRIYAKFINSRPSGADGHPLENLQLQKLEIHLPADMTLGELELNVVAFEGKSKSSAYFVNDLA